MTKKDYCDYDTCVALREIGCRIQTEWYIHQPSYERGSCYLCPNIPQETSVLDECDYIPRLSLYEAQKWLREEKQIEVNATYDNIIELHWHWYMKSLTNCNQDTSIINHDSYEQALLAGIKEAVKILTNNKNE